MGGGVLERGRSRRVSWKLRRTLLRFWEADRGFPVEKILCVAQKNLTGFGGVIGVFRPRSFSWAPRKILQRGVNGGLKGFLGREDSSGRPRRILRAGTGGGYGGGGGVRLRRFPWKPRIILRG